MPQACAICPLAISGGGWQHRRSQGHQRRLPIGTNDDDELFAVKTGRTVDVLNFGAPNASVSLAA